MKRIRTCSCGARSDEDPCPCCGKDYPNIKLRAKVADLDEERAHERRKCEALARQLEDRTDCPAEMLGVDLDCERLCADLKGEYHLCWLAWADEKAKEFEAERDRLKASHDNPFCSECKEIDCEVSMDGRCNLLRVYRNAKTKQS